MSTGSIALDSSYFYNLFCFNLLCILQQGALSPLQASVPTAVSFLLSSVSSLNANTAIHVYFSFPHYLILPKLDDF